MINLIQIPAKMRFLQILLLYYLFLNSNNYNFKYTKFK